MKQQQRGFTLIELVMVIVILGVLAAVAIPKFVDLSGDAKTAAVSGVAGGITSASSVNYASRSVTTGNGSPTASTTCLAAANLILQGGFPTNSGYSVVGNVGAVVANPPSNNCTVSLTGSTATAAATIIPII